MDVKKEMMSDMVTMFILDDSSFDHETLELAGVAGKSFKSICYVTLDKPSKEIASSLEKEGVERKRFTFVDCVATSDSPGVIEVPFPRGIAELEGAIRKALSSRKHDAFIFDSLSMLELFKDSKGVEALVHSLVTQMREARTRTLFTVLRKDIKKDLTGTLGLFMDRVVGSSMSKRIDHVKICDDLDVLVERMFGHDTRTVVSGHREDVKPEVYIKHWKEMMNVMVGPRNAETQMSSIARRIMGDIK